jgi:hypothetical protein
MLGKPALLERKGERETRRLPIGSLREHLQGFGNLEGVVGMT